MGEKHYIVSGMEIGLESHWFSPFIETWKQTPSTRSRLSHMEPESYKL